MDASDIEDIVKRKQRAIRKGNLRGAVEIGNELGFCYTNLGRYDEALEEYKQCLDLTISSNDLMGQATAHRYIGETLSKTNSYWDALKHHRQYLELAIKCKSQVEEQRAYTTLGNTHLDFASTRMKDIEGRTALRKAEESFSLALNFSEKVKALIGNEEYAQMKARLYMNLALVYELYQEEEMCINYFQQSIKISSENSLTEDLYRSLYNLSQYYKRCNKFKEAIDKCKQACNCAVKLKDDRMEMEALILLAKIHLTTSDFKLAKESLSTIYKKRHCRQTDEHAEAERMLKKVFKLLHLTEDIEIVPKKDAKTLQPLYEKAGDKAVALESFEFALCAYKNMEKCAKALGIKGKQMCPAYFSIWKTLKDLHRYPECLSYLVKEEKLEADNPKRLYKILLEKAELLEILKSNYEDVAEVYKSAYRQAELNESQEKKVYALKKLLLWQRKENKMDDASSTKNLLEGMVGKEQTSKLSELSPTFSDEEEEDDEADYDSDDDFELDKEIDLCSDNESEEKLINKNPKKNMLGETPLHRACIEGNFRRVKALLDGGHLVNVRDNCGWLPIHEATSHGYVEIAEILLDRGASINDRGGDLCQGITPLHDACSNAHVDVIELLVRRGAELLLKNDSGELPLDVLESWCREKKDKMPTVVSSCLDMLREETEKQKAALLRSFGNQGSVTNRQKELTSTSTPSVSYPKSILKRSGKSPSPPSSPTNENNRMEDIQCVSSPETTQQRVKKKLETSRKVLKKKVASKANKLGLQLSDDTLPKPKPGPKSALLKESECVGLKDWLVDDVESNPADDEDLEDGDAKVRRPNDLLSSSSSSKRTSKRKPSSVGDNDDDSNNYDEDDDRGTMKLQTKRQCKTIESIKSQNSKVLQSNNNSINNSNSFNNNNSFNSSNFNIEERPIVETEISSREPSSTKKWVNVAVGEKSIGVPFIERDQTVSWLAEEAASRYYNILGRRPRLTLSVRGMILMPEDPMDGLFCNGEEVVASIAEWIDVPIERRCDDACRNFSSTMSPSIKKAIVECEKSGFLDLSEKSLEPSTLRPICHVMQSLTSLTQLHLKGNKLRNEGFHLLVDVFKFLPYLSLVDLGSNHVTHESIAELSKHLRGHTVQDKKPLQSLEVLLLANNNLLDLSSAHLFECLKHLPSLKHLDVSSCGLTEKFFNDRHCAFESFGGGLLTYLDLGGSNDLRRMNPEALVQCFNFNRLETLHLPQVQNGFVQSLRKHLASLEGEIDFRFLSIDGKPSL